MAIVFHCKCGHMLRAQLESAGKRTKCPACEQVRDDPLRETRESPCWSDPDPRVTSRPASRPAGRAARPGA